MVWTDFCCCFLRAIGWGSRNAKKRSPKKGRGIWETAWKSQFVLSLVIGSRRQDSPWGRMSKWGQQILKAYGMVQLSVNLSLGRPWGEAETAPPGRAGRQEAEQADVAAPLERGQLAEASNLWPSAAPGTGVGFRAAESAWSGRLQGGSSRWDTSTSFNCSAVRWSDTTLQNNRDFFLSSSLPPFSLPPYFPSFIPFFPFFPLPFRTRCICVYLADFVEGNNVFHTQANKINL